MESEESRKELSKVDTQGEYGMPALMVAALNGQIDIVKRLLDNFDAQLNQRTRPNILAETGARLGGEPSPNPLYVWGWTALMCAALKGHTDVVRFLLEQGALVNIRSDRGQTALMIAAANGHIEIVRLLLERGARLNLRDFSGGTALMISAYQGHTDIAAFLIDKGAKPNIRDEAGWAAIVYAAAHGHTDTVKILLEKGAKPDPSILLRIFGPKVGLNNVDETPLMVAAYTGYADIVRLLLEKGVNPNLKTTEGKTALSLARGTGHDEIVEMLEKAGAKK